jgi:hypothetical protein
VAEHTWEAAGALKGKSNSSKGGTRKEARKLMEAQKKEGTPERRGRHLLTVLRARALLVWERSVRGHSRGVQHLNKQHQHEVSQIKAWRLILEQTRFAQIVVVQDETLSESCPPRPAVYCIHLSLARALSSVHTSFTVCYAS